MATKKATKKTAKKATKTAKKAAKTAKRPAKKATKKVAKKLTGVPAGFTTVTPVVVVAQCKQALAFWQKAFGAKVASVLPGPNDAIMHAVVRVGDGAFMCSDPLAGQTIPTALHLYVTNADAIWQRAVDAGCTVEMPLGDQFWGDRYGVLRDPSGIRWSIGQQKEVVSDAEMAKRMAALPPPPA